jgi:hypothetical protein
MRARSTRLAGSVRDRAIAANRAKSSSPIEISIAFRGAAMITTCRNEPAFPYHMWRQKRNPSQPVGFMESMY